jgi:hypothetical protein
MIFGIFFIIYHTYITEMRISSKRTYDYANIYGRSVGRILRYSDTSYEMCTMYQRLEVVTYTKGIDMYPDGNIVYSISYKN